MSQPDGPLKSCKLIPFSGTQFYTTGFRPDAVGNFSRTFFVLSAGEQDAASPGLETVRLTIKPGWKDDGSNDPLDPPPGIADEISVSKLRSYETFLGQWMPVPFLRVLPGDAIGRRNLDRGPTNWVRVLVTARPEEAGAGQAEEFDVVYLFDTELGPERGPEDVDSGPTEIDAYEETAFRFAPHAVEAGRFLRDEREFTNDGQTVRFDVQHWAASWIERVHKDFEEKRRHGRQPEEEELRRWPIEARCRYLAFLQFLAQAAPPPEIRFVDTLSADQSFRRRHDVADKSRRPVDVSLVLDIGNSRTCGVMIESFPTSLRRADLSDAMVLRLRDLTRPRLSYREPFESHVELSQPYFGFRDLSEMSGRARAFFWPSLVRVGPEAARFRDLSEGIEAVSGLSSPKRYLYDVTALNQQWRFQDIDYARSAQHPPPLDDHVRSFVGPRGDVRRQVDEEQDFYRKRLVQSHEQVDIRAYPQRLSFSRSSMFTFMLAEIVWQAFTMVNAPQVRATRAEADTPRRLSRIVLTIPTAMPITEQCILRSRAAAAVKLIWDLLGWTENPPPGVAIPSIDVTLDEASCIQFVYLYGEIAQHFTGAANEYFDLMGQKRRRPDELGKPGPQTPERSIRIASIDVGGGTTDLMVTTYFIEDAKALVPYQNFREGFRVAGDDLLRDVIQRCLIERCILPAAEEALRSAGVSAAGARNLLMERFSSERADMREQDRHRRRQFVTRILRPAAIALLNASESSDWASEEVPASRSLRDLVAAGGGSLEAAESPGMVGFLDEAFRARGARSFSVLDLTVEVRPSDIRLAVESTFGDVFGNIAEMVNHLDCDVVLFAGRPSRLPATVELFMNKLAVAPDRIVPLGSYPTGPWYPFSSLDNFLIEDPKTATVTGAMLALFAQNHIENFTIYANRLKHKSCAMQIGTLTANGQLRDESVIFTFDPDRPPGETEHGTFKYSTPVWLGYRQLPLPRWVATPLYYLRLVASGNTRAIPRPVTITIERESPEELTDFDHRLFPAKEAQKESLKITEAIAADGADVTRSFALELNTMTTGAGYWLDTGLLTIN